MIKKSEKYEIVVCGGGLAGFCAAVSSARMGRKTCLIHNRPVFGGNSSSEIGVTPHGSAAFHAYARETGIISELLIEERAVNHAEIYENGWTNSVWDMVMYDMAMKTPDLTFHLNTDIQDVVMKNPGQVQSVMARVQNSEVELTIEGEIFIDCTGDALVADKAGCTWRMGTESRSEFNELHAPERASSDTMGNSIHFMTRNMGFPVSWKAPGWATKYDDASYFYEQGRLPKDERGGFWWLEIGVPFHTIYDNETIRHELTKHALGVWDWMKNHDPVMKERCANYALDWIGQVPGKRESRRVMGEYFMTENDIQDKTVFEDEIAFGGWFVDLHTPGGLLAKSSEPTSTTHGQEYCTFDEYSVMSYCGPYGIPLRILIAKDVDNLMMAGRNISVTHAALGTIRVMGTTALMGQACGTAAAIALEKRIGIKEVPMSAISEVKQKLLRDGCFLLNNRNEDDLDLARKARVTASSEALMHGAGPETKGWHDGLKIWKDQPQYGIEQLTVQLGQLIAIGTEKLDRISLCLTNLSTEVQEVRAKIYVVTDIWDYRVESSARLAETILKVPCGENVWVDWNVYLSKENGLPVNQFIRVNLEPNTQVEWKIAGCIIPGHMGTYQIGQNKMRRFGNGVTLSFKVQPPQPVFKAINVLNGVTRPHTFTNLWKSDPDISEDPWIELSWDEIQKIKSLELTFPGHLLREYHAYSPFYRDPQCPENYTVKYEKNGEWIEILSVEDNFQRKRVHALPREIETKKLRITIHKTNGDPGASIYEIRCY